MEKPYGAQPDLEDIKEAGVFKGCKLVIVCDENGTLISESKQRYKNGAAKPRPHLNELAKLAAKGLRFAVHSSATRVNVLKGAKILEEAGIPLTLVLSRRHCLKAPNPKKRWATKKEPSKFFGPTTRFVVLDDSPEKFDPDEAKNVIIVPTWKGESSSDTVLKVLARELDALDVLDEDFDIRLHTERISATLKES